MKIAVVSDIHANLEALRAVLGEIDAIGVDALACVGDLVGYYSEPNECIDALAERGAVSVVGNHDLAAIGALSTSDFSEVARGAIAWTQPKLTPSSKRFLTSLPILERFDSAFVMVHGALHPTPNARVHLSTPDRVRRSLVVLAAQPHRIPLAFFGHTHVPVVHELDGGAIRSVPLTEPFSLRAGVHYLVNPGSVGQSRDADPRAAFLVYDIERALIEPHRVAYDRASVLRKAVERGIAPKARDGLWRRLSRGLI